MIVVDDGFGVNPTRRREKSSLDWMVMMDGDGPRQRHAAAGVKMTRFDSFDSKPCT
jgi:hypothetical protein